MKTSSVSFKIEAGPFGWLRIRKSIRLLERTLRNSSPDAHIVVTRSGYFPCRYTLTGIKIPAWIIETLTHHLRGLGFDSYESDGEEVFTAGKKESEDDHE